MNREERPFAGLERFDQFRRKWVLCDKGFWFDRRFLLGLREIGTVKHPDWEKYRGDILYCYRDYYLDGLSSPHLLTRLYVHKQLGH